MSAKLKSFKLAQLTKKNSSVVKVTLRCLQFEAYSIDELQLCPANLEGSNHLLETKQLLPFGFERQHCFRCSNVSTVPR